LTPLTDAVDAVLQAQIDTRQPLAIILAGHNGSGKSTMWRRVLADRLRLPLINADRMMLSILPEADARGHLVGWAARLRDADRGWMAVAQQGVQAFVGHAMGARVPFAMETVFSYWQPRADGTVASKIDLIRDLQAAGYFVLLVFVGLSSVELSVLRVSTRVSEGGHAVAEPTLRQRFPRTQKAVSVAAAVADAAVLVDNSHGPQQAFTVCRVQLAAAQVFDIRDAPGDVAPAIAQWMAVVSPR
jgi:predicted ABC-type ATPase